MSAEMMKTVRLIASNGEMVAEISMPPFNKMPDGVMWEHRAFFRHGNDEDSYYEGLMWRALPEMFKSERLA